MEGYSFDPIWRYSSRRIKFLIFDYRLLYFFLLCVFHLRAYTFYSLIVFAIFLFVIEKMYEYTVPAVLRRFSIFLSGKVKRSVSERRKNKSER